MWLRRLEIEGFRNITRAELYPCSGYNLITGNNGSGKSSILEAIHCLSTGRSFRTSKKQPIIQHTAPHSTLFGEIVNGETVYRMGSQKRRDGSSQLKLDGRNLDSQLELALLLPVIGLTPESEDLIADGAKVRQAYLDWTLFHVEQAYRELWKGYKRVLAQRNHALKARYDVNTIKSWDAALVNLGTEVDRLRKLTLSRLIPIITLYLRFFLPNVQISFSFRQGWPKGLSLDESLKQSLEIDKKMGFTHSGPHRSDIVMSTEHGALTQALSRGQKKLLSLTLKIAQARDYQQETGRLPIIYIDDLSAELDLANRNIALLHLTELRMQLFITCTSPVDVVSADLLPGKMFHVEHGQVMTMNML